MLVYTVAHKIVSS